MRISLGDVLRRISGSQTNRPAPSQAAAAQAAAARAAAARAAAARAARAASLAPTPPPQQNPAFAQLLAQMAATDATDPNVIGDNPYTADTGSLLTAGDNLYMDPVTGEFKTVAEGQAGEANQWMWGPEGLIPLGGSTEHSITPFLEIQEPYRGGSAIEAETWQDAARRSLEGFMRTVYTPPPGPVTTAPLDPVTIFNELSGSDPSSMYRLGTLQELIQDQTIGGNLGTTPFFDTGTPASIQPTGMSFAQNQLGFGPNPANAPGTAEFARAARAAGITPGAPVTAEQWDRLGPTQQAYAQSQFGFDPSQVADASRAGFDPLLGLSPSDKLLVFEDVAKGSPLEKMIGPIPEFIRRGTSDQDFNDYILKLDLQRYQAPDEIIKATPESVLNKFFDLPQYQLLYGQDADQMDPTERFKFDPGYQFAQDEGMKQIQRNSAARGLLESGATQRDLQQFGQGLADQNYQRFLGQQSALFSDWQNQLAGVASQGANLSNPALTNAVGGNLANALLGTGQATSGALGQAGSNISNLFANQGVFGGNSFLNTGAPQANTSMQAASLQAQIAAAQAQQSSSQSAAGGQLLGQGLSMLGGFF